MKDIKPPTPEQHQALKRFLASEQHNLLETRATSNKDNQHYAVDNVGVEVYILNGNTIVGKGLVQTRYLNRVAVELVDDAAKEFFKDTPNVVSSTWKYHYLHYNQVDGLPDIGSDDIPCQKDTRIVEIAKLRYGRVPDSFKDVPFYRAAFTPS